MDFSSLLRRKLTRLEQDCSMTVLGRTIELDLLKSALGITRAPEEQIFLWHVFSSNSSSASRNFRSSANCSLKKEKFGKHYLPDTTNEPRIISRRKVARNFKPVGIVYNATSSTRIYQFERNFASIQNDFRYE